MVTMEPFDGGGREFYDDFYRSQDAVAKKLDFLLIEVAATWGNYKRLETTVENHERRINKLEKSIR